MPQYHEPEAYIRNLSYPKTVKPDEAFHVIIKVCNRYYDNGCPADLYCKVVWSDRNETLVDKRETVECYNCLQTVNLYFTAISEDLHLYIEVGHKSFQPPYNWVVDETRDITIRVEQCVDGETKCIDSDLYECINGNWVLVEENSSRCINRVVISGIVRDMFFKIPIPLVDIIADGIHTKTDGNGAYSIINLKTGDITIKAEKTLYLPATIKKRYTHPGSYIVDIELIPLWFLLLVAGGIAYYIYEKKNKK